jgi:MarR family transcriptional regulator, 2-MHQ and catechol-resistance regulon repressor
MAGYAGTDRERLALRTFVKLIRASSLLGQRVHQPILKIDLTESQFGVLEALLHLGPLPQRQLAEKILRSHGNVTLVVDQLEKRGLVRRARGDTDRRMMLVQLTEEGRALVSGVFPAHAAHVADELSRLTEEEQRALGQLCRRLLRMDDVEEVE